MKTIHASHIQVPYFSTLQKMFEFTLEYQYKYVYDVTNNNSSSFVSQYKKL